MSVHAITPAAVRPRLDCPSWCEYTTMSSHTADYSLELSDGRISRHHARTIWENRGLDVAVQAEEVADPDGGNPSVSDPSTSPNSASRSVCVEYSRPCTSR